MGRLEPVRRSLLVKLEVLGHEPGYWCDRCALSAAVRVYTIMHGPGSVMALTSRDLCLKCGHYRPATSS